MGKKLVYKFWEIIKKINCWVNLKYDWHEDKFEMDNSLFRKIQNENTTNILIKLILK